MVAAEIDGVSAQWIRWRWAVESVGSGDVGERNRAVVLEAPTVAMALSDSSGNGRAGNGGGNRGSGGATTRNQNAAAVEAERAVLAAAMDVVVSEGSGNGGAGNGGGNRGSGRATTRNQNVAAVEAKTAVVAAAMDVAASGAVTTAMAVKQQGQIVVRPHGRN